MHGLLANVLLKECIHSLILSILSALFGGHYTAFTKGSNIVMESTSCSPEWYYFNDETYTKVNFLFLFLFMFVIFNFLRCCFNVCTGMRFVWWFHVNNAQIFYSALHLKMQTTRRKLMYCSIGWRPLDLRMRLFRVCFISLPCTFSVFRINSAFPSFVNFALHSGICGLKNKRLYVNRQISDKNGRSKNTINIKFFSFYWKKDSRVVQRRWNNMLCTSLLQ